MEKEEEYWKRICEIENIPALTNYLCKFIQNPAYVPDFAIPSVWCKYRDLFGKIIELDKAGYYENLLQAKELIHKAKNIAIKCKVGTFDQIVSLTKVQDL